MTEVVPRRRYDCQSERNGEYKKVIVMQGGGDVAM